MRGPALAEVRPHDRRMRLHLRRLEGASGERLPVVLLVPAVAVSVAALIPLVYVVFITVQTGMGPVAELIFRPRVFELFANTMALLLFTIPACVALGVGAAWLVERTDLPGRRVWAVLLAAPLVVPAFVTSYGWITIFPSLAGLGAGVLVATLSYFPLIYLPVVATLRRLDPALEEVAASLGRSPRRVFLGVVRPAAPAADPRWRVARRSAPAGRIRRLRDAPLRHLHHGDHPAVPLDVQRPGRRIAGQRARRLLPRAAPVREHRARRRAVRADRDRRGPAAASDPAGADARCRPSPRPPRWSCWPSACRC